MSWWTMPPVIPMRKRKPVKVALPCDAPAVVDLDRQRVERRGARLARGRAGTPSGAEVWYGPSETPTHADWLRMKAEEHDRWTRCSVVGCRMILGRSEAVRQFCPQHRRSQRASMTSLEPVKDGCCGRPIKWRLQGGAGMRCKQRLRDVCGRLRCPTHGWADENPVDLLA
jgi:hypothetical protein